MNTNTFTLLNNLIEKKNSNGTPYLQKIIFGNQRKKSIPYTKVAVRPVIIKNELLFQFEYHTKKSVTHSNLNSADAQQACHSLVSDSFKQINAILCDKEIQILAKDPLKPKVCEKAKTPSKQLVLSHNREKNYIIPENIPVPFLVRLGVTDSNGKVYSKHYSKFRQINRYLEIFDDVAEFLPKRKLKIIDFGCGKAYLTFALYHYLKTIKNLDVDIIGLDLKEEVIDFCNGIAKELKMDGLHFLVGDIAEYSETNVDAVVTLHACDTATDYALINAVKWNAQVILSVPCCQHELFSQITNDLHHPLYKHGIVKDRFTEILTNGLRALKLESKGYDVSMVEFTSLEHTSKNVMIRAVKTNKKEPDLIQALSEYNDLKSYYKVNPTIDIL